MLKINEPISEKIKNLRQKALKRKKPLDLDKPVSFWIKQDRLKNEIGKEFTIILRTKGCSWALGETGGCSMCSYILDAPGEDIDSTHIKNQFDFAFQKKINEIESDNDKYILKIFNSGSFFDDREVPGNIRNYIYEKIANIEKIKEIVIESRPEYITNENLSELNDFINNKYVEIGIGLETVNDYIRINYINKGLRFDEFLNAFEICKSNDISIKAYLLFKPPFLNEQAAIDDCSKSIRTLIDLKVNSISINPLNIQKGSLTETLFYQNRYRPPWYYSLFKSLKKSVYQDDLKNIRILSDPSGAGTKRGIHNCHKRECNDSMKNALNRFVLNQNLEELKRKDNECDCKKKYYLQKDYY